MTVPRTKPTADHIYILDPDNNALIMSLTLDEAVSFIYELERSLTLAQRKALHPAGKALPLQ